jgi:hypothetical protein
MAPNSKEYMKDYLKNYNVSVKCELCGGKYQKMAKSKHQHTKKHERALSKLKVIEDSENYKKIDEIKKECEKVYNEFMRLKKIIEESEIKIAQEELKKIININEEEKEKEK